MGREGESTEAGSPRPECGRAGEPRSRRPGSGRTAGRGAHSAKSRLVRLRGPAENDKLAETICQTAPPGGQNNSLADPKSFCRHVNEKGKGEPCKLSA